MYVQEIIQTVNIPLQIMNHEARAYFQNEKKVKPEII